MFKFALHDGEAMERRMSNQININVSLVALGDHGPRLRISFASETRLKMPL